MSKLIETLKTASVRLKVIEGAQAVTTKQGQVPAILCEEVVEGNELNEISTSPASPKGEDEEAPLSGFQSWVLAEWRRVSIPQWRDILQESIITGDHARADYALWMLRDILFDPEYEDGG